MVYSSKLSTYLPALIFFPHHLMHYNLAVHTASLNNMFLIPVAEWKTKGIRFHRVLIFRGGASGGRDNEQLSHVW
jgi:hypothetical protein